MARREDPWFLEEEQRAVLRQIAFFLIAHPRHGVVLRERQLGDAPCCEFDCDRIGALHRARFVLEAAGVDPERIETREGFVDFDCRSARNDGPTRPSPLHEVGRLELTLRVLRR